MTVEKSEFHTAADDVAAAADPFALENLRLPQDFAQSAGVKKLLRTVPIRKPLRHEWFRVHPGPDYRENLALLVLKDGSDEVYAVAGNVLPELVGEFVSFTLFTAISRQNVVFLWPVRLPDADGKLMEWHRSARLAAEEAMTAWRRIVARKELGAYELFETVNKLSEPKWPEVSFQELVTLAFRDCLVTSLDHPIIKKLHGRE
jgi:hypothetical protein